MQPTLISFIGLLSLGDAAVILSSGQTLTSTIGRVPLVVASSNYTLPAPQAVTSISSSYISTQPSSTWPTSVSIQPTTSSVSSSQSSPVAPIAVNNAARVPLVPTVGRVPLVAVQGSSAARPAVSLPCALFPAYCAAQVTTTSSKTSTSTTTTTSATKTTTSSTSRTTSTSASPSATWAYQGCYQDYYPSGRSLNGYSFSSASMSVETCQSTCLAQGYSAAGLENGNECYCANAISLCAPKVVFTQCAIVCSGTSGEFCGGNNVVQVYAVSGFALTTTGTCTTTTSATKAATMTTSAAATSTVGCYADFYPSSRALTGASTTTSTMTPQSCAAYCTNAGYEVSGVEYGSQCYCDHLLPTTSSSNCNVPCSGDSSKICGGANALNVVYTAASTLKTSSAKRGLSWPYNNNASTFSLWNPYQETWLYNWEMYNPTAGTSFSGATYVGLVHDTSRLEQIPWYYNSQSQVSPYLMGFNEPDYDPLISPANAVSYWQSDFLPVRKNYGTLLGAPAVTNAVGSGVGIDWLNQFNAACVDTTSTPGTSKPCFDFIPIHWYGYFLSDFTTYVANFHAAYPNYPIWVTEFAFTNHDAQSVQNLAKGAITWLDAQPYVARYAMFGPMNAANMAGITTAAMVSDDELSLTNVGKVYAGQL